MEQEFGWSGMVMKSYHSYANEKMSGGGERGGLKSGWRMGCVWESIEREPRVTEQQKCMVSLKNDIIRKIDCG